MSDGETNETAVDQRYNGLLAVIEDLKNQLIEEKQKNIKLEAEVRTELCEEFNKMVVEIESSWEQRLHVFKHFLASGLLLVLIGVK
jgi:hypothetical protein